MIGLELGVRLRSGVKSHFSFLSREYRDKSWEALLDLEGQRGSSLNEQRLKVIKALSEGLKT